jgi:hypothetical protein
MTDGKSQWRLVDCYAPVDGDDESPSFPINSQSDLRRELLRLAKEKPRIAELYSASSNEGLRVGIGGPYAGLAWIKLPSIKMLTTSHIITDQVLVEFSMQGQPCALSPDEVHTPDQIIEIVCHYFTHQKMPEGLVWR